jgi:hypothetical protein
MKRWNIQLADESRKPVIQVAQHVAPQQIIDVLMLPAPKALLILNGGTADLEAPLKAQLSACIADGLARAAAEDRITIISGGTEAGIFALLGLGIERWGQSAPCIGIAVESMIIRPGHPEGEATLEPHHSHFVLVEGRSWGDETTLMYALATQLARAAPTITIFAGGGQIAIQEMEVNAAQGREMILLAGSGRATDAVLAARAGQVDDDPRIAEIASGGQITAFDINRDPAELRQLVRQKLYSMSE